MDKTVTINECPARRGDPRTLVGKYYSVEFSLSDLDFSYQFKIWDVSMKGMCVLVREDSNLLKYLKVGDILNMKYYPKEMVDTIENFKTEVKHITKDDQGRFKGHYLIGLSILDKQYSVSS